jgi:hypothetical protein
METACDKGGKLLVLLRLHGSNGQKDVVKLPCTDGEFVIWWICWATMMHLHGIWAQHHE